MTIKDTVSETQAAAMIGWSSANLRSARLRREAQECADQLSPRLRHIMSEWRKGGERFELTVEDEEALLAEGLIQDAGRGRWALTRQGEEVSRRVRCGERQTPCAQPPRALVLGRPGGPVRLRYDVAEIERWLAANPAVADESRLLAETLDDHEAAAFLGQSLGTLRGQRSKAARARARLESDDGLTAEEVERLDRVAQSAPRWVRVGNHKRYRRADLEAWKRAHVREPDPLHRPAPEGAETMSEREFAEAAGLKVSVLPGYRSKARKQMRADEERWGPDGVSTRLLAGHYAQPAYVLHEGKRRYPVSRVRAWVRRRRPEG